MTSTGEQRRNYRETNYKSLREAPTHEEKGKYIADYWRADIGYLAAYRLKKWFISREYAGHRFDPQTYLRLFTIQELLEKEWDHFIVVQGGEGVGKSTLAMQVASWLDPTFNTARIFYGTREFLKYVETRHASSPHSSAECVILDEGTELLGSDSMKKANRRIIKILQLQRVLKVVLILCVPNFHQLDKYIRLHRVKTLFSKWERNSLKGYTGPAIKSIAIYGRTTFQVDSVKVKNGSFWNGYNLISFPDNINKEEYEKHKMKRLGAVIADLRRESELDRIKEDILLAKYVKAQKAEENREDGD